jgi:diguanylate cyclase (GGDEF)-like protein
MHWLLVIQKIRYTMKKSQFIFVLLATLITVIFLSTVWEFWLENIIFSFLFDEYESENLSIRFEYVISIAVFVFISLIFPAVIGYKLLDNDEKMKEKIKRLSEEDYLTSLYNRRKIHEIINNEIIRANRYSSTFAVIMLDIDNFKTINDSLGHNAGDKVLVQFSNVLMQTKRESDIASRWGGEEFLIFCPETTIDGAMFLAQKLRTNIEKIEFENASNITASFGVAGIEQGDDVQSLIHRADKFLYSAKKAGKNRVIGAEPLN